MNDPRSSRGREGGAQRDLPAPSDLGTKPGEWKDLEEVSRGQQDISSLRSASQAIPLRGGAATVGRPYGNTGNTLHLVFLRRASFHVRPLRGLSTLLALTPGLSRPWWLASLRHRERSTTWGHSWCDPSGVSAHAEPSWCDPSGVSAHAEPSWCTSGVSAHAELCLV